MARITYMTKIAKNIRIVRSRTVLMKVSASPCRLERTVGGTTSAAVLVMKLVASRTATTGLRLTQVVTLVNWLRWFTAWGPSDSFQVTRALSGTRFFPSSDLMYRSERSRGSDRAASRASKMTWY